jgi:hypothetical protein
VRPMRASRRSFLRAAALGLAALSFPATELQAQDPALSDDAVNECALAFLKALRKKDVGEALVHSGVPFVAEDARLLKTEAELRAYLTDMLKKQTDDSVLPNAVFGVLDYGGSRGATAQEVRALRDQVLSHADRLVGVGRDGFSRGVLLVKAVAGKPAVVGIGY